MDQIDSYTTLKDLGKNQRPPPGYKPIRVHMVYNDDHNGLHKACLIAGGHLAETLIDSV